MACPHAAIRPVLLSEEEKAAVPASFVTAPAKGLGNQKNYFFRMQVSPYDCLGCGVCQTVCPVNQNEKMDDALVMSPFEEQKSEQDNFDNIAMNEAYLKKEVINDKTIKNVQFAKPYFQFSAACAGCAETTYIKLISQLFGDHMYVGNAAGCSSAVSGGAPILPYCKDKGQRLFAYEYNGYWKDVGTLGSYWEANMELIDIIPEFNLYEEFWKIYTKGDIIQPQYISEEAVLDRCLIGEGSEIYGEVHNSVIGPNVVIGKGSVIRDSIIMRNTIIGENVDMEKAIVAEDVTIGNDVVLGCGEEAPNIKKPAVYAFGIATIGEGSVIPDNVKIGKNTAISGVTTPADYPDGILESGQVIATKDGDKA